MARPRLPASLIEFARLLTPSGWTTLATGIATTSLGLRWRHPETVLIGSSLLVVIGLAVLWMVRPTRLVGRRTVDPAHITEGDPAFGVLVVRNEADGGSPRVTAIDHVNGRPIALTMPSIRPGEEGSVRFEVPTERRGLFKLGPLRIAHSDPFRLIRAGSAVGGQAQYRVWPKSVEVSPLPTGRVRDVEGTATPRTAGSGVTFHSLREYTPGDDRRHVHWRSTAKTGELVVRQHVLTSEPKMLIFLDCRQQRYGGPLQFDDACRIAASLLRAAVRWSNPVELMLSSGTSTQIDSSGVNVESALDALADAKEVPGDMGLAQLAIKTERRHLSSSAAVITGGTDSQDAAIVNAMQSRYTSFTAIQVGEPGTLSSLPLSTTTVFSVSDLDDFATQWQREFDR